MLEASLRLPLCGGLLTVLTMFSAKPCTTLRLVKACGAIGVVDVPSASRRSAQLLARLGDLSKELTYSGLASDGYGPAFPGATLSAEQRGAALAPYRSLDADRLKLSGRANWDPSPFLHDALYLAFREPDSLLRSSIPEPSRAEVPASSAHDVEQLCKVAKIWDANDLLFLSSEGPSAERPYEAVRLFNCLKNTTTDRQIADRRGRNHVESIVPGPSREIPAGPSLQCLFAEPSLFGFGRPTEKIGITNSRFLLGGRCAMCSCPLLRFLSWPTPELFRGMLLQGSLPRGRGSAFTCASVEFSKGTHYVRPTAPCCNVQVS